MKYTNFFNSICVITLLFGIAASQNIKNDGIPKSEFIANNCENNKNLMDLVRQSTDKSKTIIIVSHLGRNEFDKFNKRRLHNAKTFINQPPFNRDLNLIIPTQGEKVKGDGFLDFFVGGILEYRFFLAKNKDLLLSGCQNEPEEKPCSTAYDNMFYPCFAKTGK